MYLIETVVMFFAVRDSKIAKWLQERGRVQFWEFHEFLARIKRIIEETIVLKTILWICNGRML